MPGIPRSIHPFPARMAPEIALAQVAALPPGSRVLDPMAGSGTVVRVAASHGHIALGFDLDPLAVLMARVWTTPIDAALLRRRAASLVETIRARPGVPVSLPWIDDDAETRAYVDYWFGAEQRVALRQLSAALQETAGPVGDALRLGLSRIIVTKDRGASLARDVSHSRPHRVYAVNDFSVLDEFLRVVTRLAEQLEAEPPPGQAIVSTGDARQLASIETGSIDAVITSPPYLNAIDYLRGHRLALVWLGYRLDELRAVRSEAVGAERAPASFADADLAAELTAPLAPLDRLPLRQRRMLDRYVLDLHRVLVEIHRVLRPGATAVLVIGNSRVRGVFIRNARALAGAAERIGLRLSREDERALPPDRRYLPPPRTPGASGLEKRMRSETVLTFTR